MILLLNNKIIKTEFFKRVKELSSATKDEIFLSYKLLMEAETYLFIDEPKLFSTIDTKIDIVSKLRQWEYLIKFLQRYNNWSDISDAIEYAYIKYITLYLGSVLRAEKLSDEDYRWKLMIQEKISRLFPYWKSNTYIEKDESIQGSVLVKEQTSEQSKVHFDKPTESKPNPFKKAWKVSIFTIKQWFREFKNLFK